LINKLSNENLQSLKKRDLKKALCIITDAFLDYPFPGGLIGDRGRRKTALYEMFKIELKYLIRNGFVLTLGGDFKEVAAVKKTTAPVKDSKYIRHLSLSSLKLLSSVSGREFKKITLAVEEIEKVKKTLALPEKTAELFILGVNPENQSEGRGKILVNSITEEMKKQGFSCLVLTNTDKNREIYEKLGFTLIEKTEDNRFNLVTYFMLKEV